VATDDERSELVCARSLLRPGAGPRLEQALATYPAHYDEVLHAVHSRLMDHGAATKLDLAALIAWKHVRNAPWMRKLLALPDVTVEAITRGAFRIELKDADRIAALDRGGSGRPAASGGTAPDPVARPGLATPRPSRPRAHRT
jgi:hypothetical protein